MDKDPLGRNPESLSVNDEIDALRILVNKHKEAQVAHKMRRAEKLGKQARKALTEFSSRLEATEPSRIPTLPLRLAEVAILERQAGMNIEDSEIIERLEEFFAYASTKSDWTPDRLDPYLGYYRELTGREYEAHAPRHLRVVPDLIDEATE